MFQWSKRAVEKRAGEFTAMSLEERSWALMFICHGYVGRLVHRPDLMVQIEKSVTEAYAQTFVADPAPNGKYDTIPFPPR